MDDLISRKALLERIEQQRRANKTGFPKQSFVVGDVINCILNAPAVEAAPPQIEKVEISFYDKEEIYENCTVQVLTNTVTGEVSVGWWQNGSGPEVLNE